MDAARFDALARTLGDHASRRVVLAGVLATLGRDVARAAKNKHRKHPLKRNRSGAACIVCADCAETTACVSLHTFG